MPIYRLNNSGMWKKLAKVYRLNNNGMWKNLSNMYRINDNGMWKKIFASLGIPTATTFPTFINQVSSTSIFYGGDTLTLTRGAYTNTRADSSTSYRMTIYKGLNSSLPINDTDWEPASRTTFTGANSTSTTSITYSLTDTDAKLGYTLVGQVTVNNDANIPNSKSYDFETAKTLSRISFSVSNLTVTPAIYGGTFNWTVSGVTDSTFIYDQTLVLRLLNSTGEIKKTVSIPAGTTTVTVSDSVNIIPSTTYYAEIQVTANDGWKFTGTPNTLTANTTFNTLSNTLPTPILANKVETTDGFYFNITNYDANNTYVISTTLGLISRTGNVVTVSGLSSGQSATASVKATRPTYVDSATATISGTALIQYTITWDPQGGSVTPSSQTVVSGTTVTAPTPSVPACGYTFAFWRNPLSGGSPTILTAGQSYTVTSNITFYAIWTLPPQLTTPTLGTVVQQTNGFYFNIDNYDVNNTYNISTSAGSVSRSGSIITVSGLASSQSATVSVFASRLCYTNSATATRTGTALPPQVTVTWDPQGGTVTPTSQTVSSGTTVTAPTPSTAPACGYTFAFWRNPLSGGSPTILNAGQSYTVTANITFYAIWTDPPQLATPTLSAAIQQSDGFYFTIDNYDANNTYNISTTAGIISRSGATVTVSGLSPNASATASVFASRSCYTNSATATRTGTALPPQVTVTWDPQGGTVTPTSQTVSSGTTVTAPTPSRSGYTFSRWRNPLSGGADPIFLNAGQSYTVTANITFYAIWVINAAPLTPTGVSLSRNQASWNGTSWTWNCTWNAPVAGETGGTATYYEAYREVGTGTVGNATLSTITNTSTPQTNITTTNTTFSTTVQAAPRADAYVRACNIYGCSVYVSGNVG